MGMSARNEGIVMTKIQALVVSATLAIGMVAPASAASSDPEVIVYRFPGVRDDGADTNVGVATAFHCTNFSGVTEFIRLVTRDNDSTLKSNTGDFIGHLVTKTYVTHFVHSYNLQTSLGTGTVGQGTTAIAATSTNIICTATTINAADSVPIGTALRGIRFNPVPGSQE